MAKSKAAAGASEIKAIESVLDSMDTCVYVTDIDTGEILFMNRKMTGVFGGRDLRGQICWKVLQDGFSDECEFCPCKSLRKNPGDTVVWEEFNTVTKKYYKNTDSAIRWPDGRMVHIQNSLDITDLKETQESLKQQVVQQELLTNIAIDFASGNGLDKSMDAAISLLGGFLNADKIALVRIDPVTDEAETVADWASRPEYLTVNRVIKRSSMDPDRFIDKRLRAGKTFVLSGAGAPDSLRALFTEKFGVKDLYNFPLFSNKGYWGFMAVQQRKEAVKWSAAVLQLQQAVCGIISLGIERKQTEDALFRTQRELREIVDTVPFCIYWKDTALNFTGCNERFAEYFNIRPADVLGKPGIPGCVEISKRMAALDKSALDSKKARLYAEIEESNPQGEKRWFSASNVPVFDAEGGITSLLGIFQDITDKKRGEIEMIERDRELERVLKIAEKSGKAKSEFLSRMSHEIRTPMNAIIGMTRIAAESGDIAKIKACLAKVDAASNQLLGIINDILDMSKIEAGKMELAKEKFNLENMLQNVCNIIMVKADERRQTLHMHIAPDVPITLIGDEVRLSQVLTNLLSNAVKFTPDKGSISLSAVLKGRSGSLAEIEFAVTDNGIGMSEEQQQRLFMAFEQGDGGISRKYGGTGLGLSISKNIVNLMNGEIRAESEKGKGSRFIFTVKIEAEDKKPRTLLSKGTSAKNLKVLVADDSAETRGFFKALMDEYNIPAETAGSGEEALVTADAAAAAGAPFSIAFIDWRMPGMNGIETAKALMEKQGDNIGIVLFSASEWANMEEQAVAAGIKHFLHKPLFSSMIINTVNEILGAPAKAAAEGGGKETPDFSGNTVLVAEDIEINRDILSAILEPSSLTLSYAENGRAAVEMFTAAPGKYDLILMDIHMPEMDGYEATRVIRRMSCPEAKTVPIIAMTANVFSEDVQRCLESGMNGHLGKPIDEKKLFDKLGEYLKAAEVKEMENIPQESKPTDYAGYLPYIDIADGLARIRGNKKLYGMMLKSFKSNPLFPQAKAALLAGDLKTAQLQMHTLKGVAGNLSLKRLYELVVPVEAVLKTAMVHEREFAPIEEAFDKTLLLIDNLLDDLKAEGAL